jgi:hypothetical protein
VGSHVSSLATRDTFEHPVDTENIVVNTNIKPDFSHSDKDAEFSFIGRIIYAYVYVCKYMYIHIHVHLIVYIYVCIYLYVL